MKHTNQGHGWLMFIGCLIPIAALIAIRFFNISVGNLFVIGLFLLCPLLHWGMMRGGGHTHGSEIARGPSSIEENAQTRSNHSQLGQ